MNAEIVQSFNARNKAAYALENGFPDTGKSGISIRNEENNSASHSKTCISRAGFNDAADVALVYVEHITELKSGVGYFVMVTKTGGVGPFQDFNQTSLLNPHLPQSFYGGGTGASAANADYTWHNRRPLLDKVTAGC